MLFRSRAGGKIVREDDTAKDTVKGNFQLDVEGGYKVSAGKLSLSSLGAISLNSFGPVVNLAKGLPEWITVTRKILDKLSTDEANAIANGTAQTVYKVVL